MKTGDMTSMTYPIDAYLTALTAASTEVYQGHDVVRRGVAKAVAAELGLPCPNWFINAPDGRWKLSQPGRFRIPTAQEAATAIAQASTRAPRTNRTTPAPSSVQLAQQQTARPRRVGRPRTVSITSSTPAPAPSSVSVASLVRDDAANTTMQTEISRALGVDVIFGSSDDVPVVPTVDAHYVPWGFYEELRTIVQSGQFLPVMIVGPSGNGKSVTPEQICAQLRREYVRVNITKQTDEDDLIGGFRLIHGDTKFALGPVPLAMLRGAVLNLDEIDLGGAALMCMQSVLEGKPLYIKKIGRYITPASGFTVVATSNTKGRGDDGRYMHTAVMNDAMLERFAVMFEHGWAEPHIEKKIVGNILKSLGKYDATLTRHLVEFANVTRKNYEEQVCEDQIATRRLLHLCRVYAALGNLDRALDLTLARFDKQTAIGFKSLWNAIHDDPTVASPSGAPIAVEPVSTEQV